MSVETIRMSSKGQIVIPQDIRDDLNVGEGTVFAVIGSKDSIVLKKIVTPSKADLIKDLENIAKEGKKRLQAKGVKEEDFAKIIEKRRKAK
ncbi:MAG: AbrB/MazE/SpoVT family DNA-binding domain-containing protein [Nanoarchaeota archaeon]|nr:AbrB/MazE/SpoVT family DNA-binding domain-containing protein [Nanoarchaeota archaeon]